MEKLLEVGAEAAQGVEPVGSRFFEQVLGLEDLAAVLLDEYTHYFPHAPSGNADHAQTVGRGFQQSDAAVAQGADRARVAVISLEFEAGEVDLLELLCGIHRKLSNCGIAESGNCGIECCRHFYYAFPDPAITQLHFVAAEVFVAEVLEPAAEFVLREAVGDVAGLARSFKYLVFDKDGAVDAQ